MYNDAAKFGLGICVAMAVLVFFIAYIYGIVHFSYHPLFLEAKIPLMLMNL